MGAPSPLLSPPPASSSPSIKQQSSDLIEVLADRGAAITISPPLILPSPYMSGVAGKDGQRRRHHRLAIAYLPPPILLFPPPCMSGVAG
ncbi:unnamed protein product [Linum trigynum]